MCAFDIDSSKANQLSAGSTFGAVQAMQKKQEEADAKKAQEKNSLLQDDTVSISDEAKLIINSQLGKLAAKGNLMDAASASELVDQVRKAEEAIDKINGSREDEGDSLNLAPTVTEEEATEKAADPKAGLAENLEEQIRAKEGEIQELASDTSEEAQMKVQMLQLELTALQAMLTEMRASATPTG